MEQQNQTPNIPKSPYPSPRAVFITSAENVANHRKLIDSVVFKTSVDAALNEYTRAIVALSGTKDLDAPGAQQGAAAAFHMIAGAHQFLEVFHRMAEPYPKQDPSKGQVKGLN